ncbi:S41 family peptidase [Segetibacter koreensis]|uniref:S41 family peptidase n=1 Tax=Segetibacter koreensis TaxID=398037 RepID=UPI0003822536|nr:S41 family peptidase [Segetibacter koreensis]
MPKIPITISTILILFITSCKKDINNTPSPSKSDTSSLSQTDLLKDSVYLYSKEIYLWRDVLPSYEAFNPRQYQGSDDEKSASLVMNAIRNLEPLDRFSFVTTKETSEGLQTGADVDYGFFIKAASIDKADPIDSVRWFVTYVFDKSPAGLAGVNRGWSINSINNTPVTYSQSSIDLLNKVFFGNTTSASFGFVKPDGTTATASLSKTSFISNSVLYSNVINYGGKKIGYFVYKQFFGAPSRTELNTVFSNFKSQGINELVVDLRYNPGGSTATQDALADLIAPASVNNKTMYKYVYNESLQKGDFPLLKHKAGFENESFSEANNTQNFANTGSLNLNRVFFIVTGGTASASELLINNLKPYMDVKLIGDTTYGKPVGFFPVDIFNYSIYPISFKTVNSAGNADYYNGFAPDKIAPDGVSKNWGDITEPSLASALKYISTGSFRATEQGEQVYKKQMKMQKQFDSANRTLESKHFNGMFIEKNK